MYRGSEGRSWYATPLINHWDPSEVKNLLPAVLMVGRAALTVVKAERRLRAGRTKRAAMTAG